MPEEAVVTASDATEEKDAAEVSADGQPEEGGEKADPQANANPDEQPEKPKRLGGWQRKNLRLQRENQELRAKLAAGPAAAAEKPAADDAEPLETDVDEKGEAKYPTYEAWVRANARWHARQEIKAERAAQAKAEAAKTQQSEAQKLHSAWTEKVNTARGKHADYDAVCFGEDSPLPDIPEGSEMDRYLFESPLGAELVYHLAQHPEEIDRIAALGGRQQVAELGKLELKLTNQKPATEEDEDAEDDERPQRPSTVSQAPNPPTPARRSTAAATAVKPGQPGADKLPDEVWFRERIAQKQKKR
jgi:hypothetical protein